MNSASVWLVAVALCWGFPSPLTTLGYEAVFYVTPFIPNPNCPQREEPCFTINQYAQGNHFDGYDNIALFFLNGEHNLIAQDFKVYHKMSLKMAPIDSLRLDRVVVRLFQTGIIVQNISEVKLFELEFALQSTDLTDYTDCLSISNIGLLSVTQASLNSCQLSLFEKVKATITELTANKSHIRITSTLSNQTVALKRSKLYFSTLDISDGPLNFTIIRHIMVNALSIESCLMHNSLVKLKSQRTVTTLMTFFLSILNSSISSYDCCSSETGIKIESHDRATIHALVEHCSIVGNYQGINAIVEGESHVELTVNYCSIENNSGCVSEPSGGIAIFHSEESNAISITTITYTTLSSNKYSQISVVGYSGTAGVTVFNSTIRSTYHCNNISAGAYFEDENDYGCSNLEINIIQSLFSNNCKGMKLIGKCSHINSITAACNNNCKHEVFFSHNIVKFSNVNSINSNDNLSIPPDGGLIFYAQNSINEVSIANSLFTLNGGSAISFFSNFSSITVTETVIEQNLGGILVYNFFSQYTTTLVIKDSIFQENNGVCLGTALYFTHYAYSKPMDVTIKNVTFFNNKNEGHPHNAGIIDIDKTISLNLESSCVFRANLGSPIKARSTVVTLSGTVIFENNVAIYGGAIYLSNAMLRLHSVNHSNVNILFVNNTAKISGGSVYVDYSTNIDPYTGSGCFYDEIKGVSYDKFQDLTVNLTLVFMNNTASNGGNAIYGVTPNSHCYVLFENNTIIHSHLTLSMFVYDSLFETFSSNLSSISSDPERVCLCDSSSQLMCANFSYIFYNTTRYPGEIFSLFLAVIGLEFGTVAGPIYADLLPQINDNFMSSLGKGQQARQYDANGCKQFEFTVNSINSNETITLKTFTNRNFNFKKNNTNVISSALEDYYDQKTHTIPYNLLTVPVFIEVNLLDCPPGFQLTKNGRCDCATGLKDIGISTCTIHNNTLFITRNRNQWIQVIDHKGILYSKHCPFNYCVNRSINLNLNNPDMQCALNHTGILCGACPSNLSLAIGSSRCLECSESYYLYTLLIAFGAAGLLLVVFIKILDITVTIGAINGLIFYANIVWANQGLLFPSQAQTSSLLQFLKVFIAWLNLDLGIETCFIQHLDGYWKTWLQFAFPAYIWLIAGLIVLISHYSIKATYIFGNNSVSVLATLFLLSYAKLLRTILIVLGFTLLETPQGQIGVWSFDGNIQYFGLKHSILFVVATVLLLVVWLQYTFALLFIKCLRKYSHKFLLRWVNKLKPLFDSYLGPLKPKHHYWIGLGLLARLILLLSSAVTLTTIPFIAMVMIIITAFVFGSIVSSVYKQWQLCLIEGFFLFNMATFSSGALFIEAQGKTHKKDALACTSLGIAFFLFLAIILYHVWRRLRSLIRHRINAQNGYTNTLAAPTQSLSPRQRTTYQEVYIPELRESLLESPVA